VPYIHVTLASGRPTEVKRQLIGGLTGMMERVLEVTRSDIHVLLWRSRQRTSAKQVVSRPLT
jgi:phenylpyruvate tautomerase PptA (4-oxalocrotonate tautomerase family)